MQRKIKRIMPACLHMDVVIQGKNVWECCETAGLKMKCLIVFCLLNLIISSARAKEPFNQTLKRSSFPEGFVFGAGSSAYQIEGAALIDGRRPSIWDTFIQQYPEYAIQFLTSPALPQPFLLFAISSRSCCHYGKEMLQEDVALMKEIGLDSYRFSISWPRILPGGKISRGVNWAAVSFYNRLIDELLSKGIPLLSLCTMSPKLAFLAITCGLCPGIEPFITLFHWDLPQALEDEDDFRDYADICFKEFGNRVRHWVTVNEPNLYSVSAYAIGEYATGRCSDYNGNCPAGNSATEPYVVAHHKILCHATAVNLYTQKYQTPESRQAASRALDFWLGWIMNPLTYGNYPKTMEYLVGDRLPEFTKAEAKIVKGSFDFIGINYYTSSYADNVAWYNNVNLSYTTDSRVNLTSEKDGIPICETTNVPWMYICPEGIQQLMVYLKRKYNNPAIFITENGVGDSGSLAETEALEDRLRIKCHSLHLQYLLNAIMEGVDVRGYYAWSFLDDFEWSLGYTLRFGLTYADFENKLRRLLKSSALWFKHFLQTQNITTHHSPMFRQVPIVPLNHYV
ncbi:hypothetical protein Tsubulata_039564 [Turnera subulata]|uniref:Beta-glucosidase n=1 Tax=Turnera subulata TaxID=218843 RepID=A0A9Q0JNU5_9ROSI|nr:hypothetical protein Tsubulata_039564 [Turnera subulata]